MDGLALILTAAKVLFAFVGTIVIGLAAGTGVILLLVVAPAKLLPGFERKFARSIFIIPYLIVVLLAAISVGFLSGFAALLIPLG